MWDNYYPCSLLLIPNLALQLLSVIASLLATHLCLDSEPGVPLSLPVGWCEFSIVISESVSNYLNAKLYWLRLGAMAPWLAFP